LNSHKPSIIMRAAVVCLVLLASIAVVCADPPKPVLKEEFETEFAIHMVSNGTAIFGNGVWAVDVAKKHASERMEYSEQHKHHNVHVLTRADLNMTYVITHDGTTPKCVGHNSTLPVVPVWSWLANATYAGQKDIHHLKYDIWEAKFTHGLFSVAVNTTHANHPVFFEQRYDKDELNLHFHKYQQRAPDARHFVVPDICKKL